MKKTFNITYPSGLHARPSTALVKLLKQFDVKTMITNDRGQDAPGDSILDVLTLGAIGSTTFEITGKDAEKAMNAVESFINHLNVDQHW